MLRDFGQLFRLDGKTALVVGAGRGIGHAVALGLADFGSRVLCADIDGAENTASEISSRGGEAESVALDMLDPASIQEIAARVGTVDVLVSSPSINVRKRLLEVTDEEFDKVIDLNMKGNLRLMRVFGDLMRQNGAGSIILFPASGRW